MSNNEKISKVNDGTRENKTSLYNRPEKVYTPAVDVIEKKDGFVLFADMPGVDSGSVNLTIEKDILTINGRAGADMPENYKPTLLQYHPGDYKRSFKVSDDVDRDKISASVANGVLKVVLPKAESQKARKIAISANA